MCASIVKLKCQLLAFLTLSASLPPIPSYVIGAKPNETKNPQFPVEFESVAVVVHYIYCNCFLKLFYDLAKLNYCSLHAVLCVSD